MKIPILLFALSLVDTAHADCAGMFAAHRTADMTLPYARFDQTEGSGFRVLATAGCYLEAEQLIVLYVKVHDEDNDALWWHAAQMAASAGDYSLATRHAKRSIATPRPADADPLLWNEYVLASMAFFERDKPGLQRYRDFIASNDHDFWGNRLNVNLLDTMLENFDLGYAQIGEKAMKRWAARPQAKPPGP